MIAALTACTSAVDPEPAEPTGPRPTDGSEDPAADLVAWIADAEWSWSDSGTALPFALDFASGEAVDGLGRSYEIVETVPGDANGDGVADVAVRVAQGEDGGGEASELWYLWLGVPDAADGEPAGEQVAYPIARTEQCGDTTLGVRAVDDGFRIDQALRLPYADDALPCTLPGSGMQVRDVRVESYDGTWYPVQVAPVPAWGGICPRTTQVESAEEPDVAARAAPPGSAPVVTDASRPTVLVDLPESPLMQGPDAAFIGFSQAGDETADEVVDQHCAFR